MADCTETQDALTSEARFLSQLDVIQRVIASIANRNHLSAADAEDFASHVKLKLVENNYAIFRKFQGRSSLCTYLTVVIQRIFLDYRIKAWGKWRPSAEARRAGPAAVLLEQLIIRDGHTYDEACEVMATNHRVPIERPELERLVVTFPVRSRRRFESDHVLSDLPATGTAADASLAEWHRRELAARFSEALGHLMCRFEKQDQLIIALRFEDGRRLADIARLLGLDQKALYRRFERLLRELRAGLEAEGLNGAAVVELLDGPESSFTGVLAKPKC